jgi:hypothetical protein
MPASKPAKSIFPYLSLLAVILAVTIGLFIGKGLYPVSRDAQAATVIQFSTVQDTPPLLIVSGAEDPCFTPEIYTSLPPKCRTADGSFTQTNGLPSNVFVIPQGK